MVLSKNILLPVVICSVSLFASCAGQTLDTGSGGSEVANTLKKDSPRRVVKKQVPKQTWSFKILHRNASWDDFQFLSARGSDECDFSTVEFMATLLPEQQLGIGVLLVLLSVVVLVGMEHLRSLRAQIVQMAGERKVIEDKLGPGKVKASGVMKTEDLQAEIERLNQLQKSAEEEGQRRQEEAEQKARALLQDSQRQSAEMVQLQQQLKARDDLVRETQEDNEMLRNELRELQEGDVHDVAMPLMPPQQQVDIEVNKEEQRKRSTAVRTHMHNQLLADMKGFTHKPLLHGRSTLPGQVPGGEVCPPCVGIPLAVEYFVDTEKVEKVNVVFSRVIPYEDGLEVEELQVNELPAVEEAMQSEYTPTMDDLDCYIKLSVEPLPRKGVPMDIPGDDWRPLLSKTAAEVCDPADLHGDQPIDH